jgi:hypothetical protein
MIIVRPVPMTLPTLVVPRAHAMQRTMDLLAPAKADVPLVAAHLVAALLAVVPVEVDAVRRAK